MNMVALFPEEDTGATPSNTTVVASTAASFHEDPPVKVRIVQRTTVTTPVPGVTNFVHIGLVVEDLDETVRFLALLGFDCGAPGVLGGEWIDRIIGLENVTVETVMARAPDGSDMFEVVRFRSPSAGAQEPAPAANRPGLRHVAFKVDDVRGVVERVREAGWETVGEIVDFENTFLLCYVRGPEGLIVELAERLDGESG
jgi:catechol 2,3-dioxygenase-like lactoylglutathione lyase family enzyme